ncbi:MAG: DUF2189 domain-containing protein [Lysobacterales bacterium]
MNESNSQGTPDKEAKTEAPKPFVAPCRDLPRYASLSWLKLGWADYRAAPGLSVSWGAFCFLLSALVAWTSWKAGGWVLLISLLSGFVFVAPLLAFGMYSVSRQLCLGEQPTLKQTLRSARRPFTNSLVFTLALLIIFLLWARAASMVSIFFPARGHIELSDLVMYLGVGSAVGSIFAAFCFAATVFSLPFIANRDVDVVTAVVSSIHAVLRNRWTLFYWALCVVILTGIGFVTAMIGFVVIIPWLGYATWHGYREALDVSGWNTLPAVE